MQANKYNRIFSCLVQLSSIGVVARQKIEPNKILQAGNFLMPTTRKQNKTRKSRGLARNIVRHRKLSYNVEGKSL